jgi:hypothetical protein
MLTQTTAMSTTSACRMFCRTIAIVVIVSLLSLSVVAPWRQYTTKAQLAGRCFGHKNGDKKGDNTWVVDEWIVWVSASLMRSGRARLMKVEK